MQKVTFSNHASAKINFLIVNISLNIYQSQLFYSLPLWFVANVFLLANILETTPASRKQKFFVKVIEAKRSSK